MRQDKDDNTPVVMRGKLPDGRTTFARIPIRNKYPLPDDTTPPIEALTMLIRYAHLMVRYEMCDTAKEVIEQAIDILNAIDYVYEADEEL